MNTEIQPTYVLQFCGVSNGNPGPGGAAAILLAEDRTVLCRLRLGMGHELKVIDAEYCALILGLKEAKNKGYKNIIAEGDSRRVVHQVKGFEYAHKPTRRIWKKVLDYKEKLHSFDIKLIPRVENSLAVAQANQAVNLGECQVQIENVRA